MAGTARYTLRLLAVFLPLLIGPAVVGLFLDRQLERFPWLTLTGVLLGSICATVVVTRALSRRYDRIAPHEPSEDIQ